MASTIGKEKYLKTAQLFQWATGTHYAMWFTGRTDRHYRTEEMLPRLVRYNKLISRWWNNRLIYISPRQKANTHYDHGLGVTEGMVRLWRSDMQAEIIKSSFFRGLNNVPEFGLHFPTKTLLYEFCTFDNFKRVFKSKIEKYNANYWKIEEKLKHPSFVLFVADVPKEMLLHHLEKLENLNRFSFVDYETFKSVPLGEQLTAPIYIWGKDLKTYPLREK